jgi:hypothetical protein
MSIKYNILLSEEKFLTNCQGGKINRNTQEEKKVLTLYKLTRENPMLSNNLSLKRNQYPVVFTIRYSRESRHTDGFLAKCTVESHNFASSCNIVTFYSFDHYST